MRFQGVWNILSKLEEIAKSAQIVRRDKSSQFITEMEKDERSQMKSPRTVEKRIEYECA